VKVLLLVFASFLVACGSNGTSCVSTVPTTHLVEIACSDGPQGICFSEYATGF
jgi:hypothetical protein